MDNVKAALANLAVSGIKVSPFCKDLMYKIQAGEMSYLQAIALIKEKYVESKK